MHYFQQGIQGRVGMETNENGRRRQKELGESGGMLV